MMDIEPGTILDGCFEILDLESRGAQATVYRARQLESNLPVAVKLVTVDGDGCADAVRRLANEHAMLESLSGLSFFLRPVKFNETETGAYLAMEWIDGVVDGARFIEQHSPMDLQTWLWVSKKIAMAVVECHRRGFLHRDIKPRNVLVAPSGDLKLIDFGIAYDQSFMQLGEADVNLGTLPYVAPEQIEQGEIGVPGEVFALGVTLYEFLTSSVPFKADTPGEIMQLKSEGRFLLPSELNPESPEWVDNLMLRVLDPRPEERPQGARELLSLLTVGEEVAVDVEHKALRVCKKCRQSLWLELPFCSHCGLTYRLRIEHGPAAVVAYRVDDQRLLIEELQDATGYKLSGVHSRLFKGPYPRVMVASVDCISANFIADSLTSPNVVLRGARIGVLKRLSLAKLSVFQSGLAFFLLVLLTSTLLSIPFTTSIETDGWWAAVFSPQGISAALCLVVIGFLIRVAFSPMVPNEAFAIKRRSRQWKALGEMRTMLLQITDPEVRRKASALVRRATLLFDRVSKHKLSEKNRQTLIAGLDSLLFEGLQRLLKLDQTSEALGQVQRSGITRQRAALEASLLRAQEPMVIDHLTTRLGEIEKLASVQREVTLKCTLDQTIFSGILSELNSLHVTMNHNDLKSWQADLAAAAKQYRATEEGDNGEESGRT